MNKRSRHLFTANFAHIFIDFTEHDKNMSLMSFGYSTVPRILLILKWDVYRRLGRMVGFFSLSLCFVCNEARCNSLRFKQIIQFYSIGLTVTDIICVNKLLLMFPSCSICRSESNRGGIFSVQHFQYATLLQFQSIFFLFYFSFCLSAYPFIYMRHCIHGHKVSIA